MLVEPNLWDEVRPLYKFPLISHLNYLNNVKHVPPASKYLLSIQKAHEGGIYVRVNRHKGVRVMDSKGNCVKWEKASMLSGLPHDVMYSRRVETRRFIRR